MLLLVPQLAPLGAQQTLLTKLQVVRLLQLVELVQSESVLQPHAPPLPFQMHILTPQLLKLQPVLQVSPS